MAPTKASACLQQLRIGAVMADDLDQLQPRHRIEEMQADAAAPASASVVRRSCSGMLEVLVARIAPGFIFGSSAGIDLLLQLELFRHRLDDEIGVADALAVHIGDQPVQRVAHARCACA